METAAIVSIIIYVLSLLAGAISLLFVDALSGILRLSQIQLAFAIISWMQVLFVGTFLLFRLWIPHPVRLALASVRYCRMGALVAFIGPLGLLGIDTFVARLPGGFEIKFEHAGPTAVAGILICLYYMNKFEDRFDRHWKNYHKA